MSTIKNAYIRVENDTEGVEKDEWYLELDIKSKKIHIERIKDSELTIFVDDYPIDECRVLAESILSLIEYFNKKD